MVPAPLLLPFAARGSVNLAGGVAGSQLRVDGGQLSRLGRSIGVFPEPFELVLGDAANLQKRPNGPRRQAVDPDAFRS